MSEVQIKMSLSTGHLGILDEKGADYYGLTKLPIKYLLNGIWYVGPESAWRKLADEIDVHRNGDYPSGSYAKRNKSLHERLDRKLFKSK